MTSVIALQIDFILFVVVVIAADVSAKVLLYNVLSELSFTKYLCH